MCVFNSNASLLTAHKIHLLHFCFKTNETILSEHKCDVLKITQFTDEIFALKIYQKHALYYCIYVMCSSLFPLQV